jgi:hypothetical protein
MRFVGASFSGDFIADAFLQLTLLIRERTILVSVGTSREGIVAVLATTSLNICLPGVVIFPLLIQFQRIKSRILGARMRVALEVSGLRHSYLPHCTSLGSCPLCRTKANDQHQEL